MDKVQILLSSYNGESYIEDQLCSLTQQTYSNISILIRDDGSTDETVERIKQFSADCALSIQLLAATNVGVVGSFFELLYGSAMDAEYLCFCDQDDVWLEHKVESAIRLLKLCDSSKPAMVFTSTKLVDTNLRTKGNWPSTPKRPPSFYNALVQNIAVGATITMNKAARDMILAGPRVDPRKVIMHDWWLYLLASAFGSVIYDPQPSILYRQHGNNVVGADKSILRRIQRKYRSYIKHKGKKLLKNQAEEFYRVYGSKLDEEKKSELELFIIPRNQLSRKIKFLYRSKLYRQSMIEQLIFRYLILTGHI